MKKLSVIFLIIGLIITVGCSSNDSTVKPPSPGEKKQTSPATYLPKDTSPEEYLKKYYTLYAEKKYKESYEMLPSAEKDNQSFEEYEQMRKSMPIKSFDVGTKSEQDDSITIDVKLEIEQFGEWNVAWSFTKDKKGIIVEDYAASTSDTSSESGSDSKGSDSGAAPQ